MRMRHRAMLLVSLILSAAAVACADTSTTAPAPHRAAPTRSASPDAGCRSGYQSSTGWVCVDSTP